ncbi:membrane protein [Syntrophus gentianae]|uniref:Membrane protein n=1 Tax=Syntrophus gentianae TaxID=43775 RepID=A0A1H7XWH0_9BACT|nr:YihY/virulence factor BrkB family protein [Syntrophus gentianae]SEM38043.1 membrane protein [Syntrophus gentianae]
MENSIILLQKFVDFIRQDIWRIRRVQLPPVKSFFVSLLRILILSVRRFDEDKCQLHASALTFYSLVSIVPIAAMAFGIAKGFGFEKLLEAQLREKLAGHEEVLANIIQFSSSLLENTKGGVVAGIGLVVLFWAVIKMLMQIEDTFNDIWGIKRRRSIGRMFSDYLSLMLIGPILVILSSSVTLFISAQVKNMMQSFYFLGVFSPFVFLLLKLLPFCLLWSLFTFFYIFMPNTKVRFSSGLLGGILAGTIFQMVQWAYFSFQIGVVQYNAIYGSFAVFPLFLVWLQLSWLIVLYGAELSFAYQNVDTYEFEADALQASHRVKTLLALQITSHLVKNFSRGEQPLTARQISHDLETPIRFVQEILFELVQSHVVSITEGEEEGEQSFQPALDINRLTIRYVLEAMDHRGLNSLPFTHSPEFDELSETMEIFGQTVEKLSANRLLKDL